VTALDLNYKFKQKGLLLDVHVFANFPNSGVGKKF
jgi:hypothetical protein